MKFGRLTPVAVSEKYGVRAWLCQCDCGRMLKAVAYELKVGKVKSCGCLRNEAAARNGSAKRHAPGSAMLNALMREYRRRASKKGLDWALSKEQVRIIVSQNCYFCGQPPSQIKRPKQPLWGELIYNGIDRLDNEKGYTPDNCVPCCKACNYAKSDRSVPEFLSWIKNICTHQNI